MSNLIIDIETISIDSERMASYKEYFEPEEVIEEPEIKPKRKARAPKSAKPGLHWLTGRIICACVKFDGHDVVSFADEDEEVLLVGLHDYLLARFPYMIITYNGKAFDIPFIIMRGALYGLDFASLLSSDRYSKSHFDVFENIAGGKWGLPAKLSEVVWHLGLPNVEGTGSDVQRQYDEGRIDEIIAHCTADVNATENIYRILFNKKQ